MVSTDEKIGLNIKEASRLMGINEKLMSELTHVKGFPCIKFKRRIVLLLGLTYFFEHVIIKENHYILTYSVFP